MIYFLIFLIGFILAFVFCPTSIKISRNLNILSKPKKGELTGKPCLGGIGIFIAFVAAMILGYSLEIGYSHKVIGLFSSLSLVVLLGVIDDVKDLNPNIKIIVELIAIGVLVSFGISTAIVFLPKWANILITFAWIIFITNAFNMLDIMDGLISGIVIIISLTLLTITMINRDVLSSAILLALLGAHLGFIKYNYPPARLYMGDTGSLFSGFVLAVVAINISYAPLDKPIALLTPILVMSLPIYDTFFLIIMRIKKHKPIFSKTNDHFALRLQTIGNDVRKSIRIMYLFSIFLAACSLIVAFGPTMAGIIALGLVVVVFIFAGKKIGMVKVED